MNGIEKITARIEAEAVADAALIVEEGAEQCRAIRAEGEEKARELYWERLQEGTKASEARADMLSRAADMEARKSILACKQEILNRAFDRAEEKLRAMTGEEYIAFLAGQAARASSTGEEELILNAQDRASLGEQVVERANRLLSDAGRPAQLVLSKEPGAFSGGLILRSGSITVNCTLEALLSQAREEQAAVAAAELFG